MERYLSRDELQAAYDDTMYKLQEQNAKVRKLEDRIAKQHQTIELMKKEQETLRKVIDEKGRYVDLQRGDKLCLVKELDILKNEKLFIT